MSVVLRSMRSFLHLSRLDSITSRLSSTRPNDLTAPLVEQVVRQQRKKRRNHFPLTPAQFGVLVRGFLFYIYSKPYLARSKLRRAGSFSLSRMIMKLKTPYLIRYLKSAKRICYKLECRKIEKKTVKYSYHMITIPVMVHETLQYHKNSSRKPRNAIQSNPTKKLTDPNQYAK